MPDPWPQLPPALVAPGIFKQERKDAQAGAGVVPVDVLFLRGSGTWRADTVLGDGGTGAECGRRGLRLWEGECSEPPRGEEKEQPKSSREAAAHSQSHQGISTLRLETSD